MPADPKIIERTFTLPKGLAITGQVLIEATRLPVAGVEIRDHHPVRPGEAASICGFPGKTDEGLRVILDFDEAK